MYKTLGIISLAAFISFPMIASAQVSCTAARTGAQAFAGVCLEGSDTVFRLAISPPKDDKLWRGTITDRQGFPGPIGIDDSIFRYGRYWAGVTAFHVTSDQISFTFPSKGSVTPSETDLAILVRAREYLSDSTHWSRDPDPDVAAAVKDFLNKPDLSRGGFCPSRVPQTLFCALYNASVQIAGEYWWGRPAINAIRAAVMAESAGKLQHPLMQFNSAPGTSLKDVQRVLDLAIGFTKERRMCNVQYWVWLEMRSSHCR